MTEQLKKTYRVTLTTKGPIFIGSGNVMKKSEYIYKSEKSLVYIVNSSALTRYLSKKKILDKFVQEMDSKKSHFDLYKFLNQNRISENDWDIFTTHTERVNQGKTDGKMTNQRSKRQSTQKGMNDLNLFIRDNHGQAYIPGSSLKGALRTVIEPNLDKKDINSQFQLLSISDSQPISNRNLEIFQKLDVNKVLDNPMPIYRECIKTDVEIEFILTIDNRSNIKITDIEKWIKKFYRNYWNNWLFGMLTTTDGGKKFVQAGGITSEINAKNNTQFIYLGGGSGFVSKTAHYQEKDKNKAREDVFDILKRKFPAYRKMKETPKNVPMALKASVDHSKNKYYQQGLCKIEFKEI